MSEYYYYAWALYGVAALGLLYLGWLLFRLIKMRAVCLALMALLAALLLTPAKMIPGEEELTPALMITLLDGLASGWSGAWNGLKYILLVYVALLLLLVFGYLILMPFRSKKVKTER